MTVVLSGEQMGRFQVKRPGKPHDIRVDHMPAGSGLAPIVLGNARITFGGGRQGVRAAAEHRFEVIRLGTRIGRVTEILGEQISDERIHFHHREGYCWDEYFLCEILGASSSERHACPGDKRWRTPLSRQKPREQALFAIAIAEVEPAARFRMVDVPVFCPGIQFVEPSHVALLEGWFLQDWRVNHSDHALPL